MVEAKPAVGLARWARLTVVLRRLPYLTQVGGRLASITKVREGIAGRAECSREQNAPSSTKLVSHNS